MTDDTTTNDQDPIEDTEGHGVRPKFVKPVDGDTTINTQDTTGHAIRAGKLDPADDAEGHGVRPKFVKPAEDTEDTEDTEGHGRRAAP